MRRLVVGADALITSDPFVGPDGEAVASIGTPTVSVVNAAGTTLAVPVASAVADGTGRYKVTLTAATHLTQPDRLTLTWTGGGQTVVDQVDVASDRYATVADVRSIAALADPGEFSAARILAAITEFEDIADTYRGIAYVRRVSVDRVRVEQGCSKLSFDRVMVRQVRAIYNAAGTALPVTSWALNGRGFVNIDSYLAGIAYSTLGAGYDVTVVWEHGQDTGVPETLRRATVQHVRSTLLNESSGLSRDVIATAEQGFVTRYSTPSWKDGRPTGFTEVDRLLNQIPDRRPAGIA